MPAVVPAPIARLKDELASLERAYSAGHHGRWSARRRSDLVDAALVELYGAETSAAERAPRTALVALGGYGRGALVPRSDIDLLLLHDGTEPPAVAALSERLLYPLWDAGFTVGHAVRTPAETRRAGGRTAGRRDRRARCPPARRGRRAHARGRGPGPRAHACRSGRVRRGPGGRRSRTTRALRLDRLPPGTGAEGGRRRVAGHPRVRLAPERSVDGRSRTTGCSGAPSVRSWTRPRSS